ncbi:MAG TPA: PAS domain S-box protein, partial [Steroidobacteraceae bacterium]|nr:PAS domain S-box protein [Steroidobacteraceae bacterium]
MELVRGESQGDGGRDEPAIGGSVLRNALRAAGIGAWAMDLVRDRMTWSHALHEIFGVDPAQLAGTCTEYRAFVHSQDAESVAAAGPVGRRPAGGETLDVEYRVVRPSGEVRLIRERGAIRFDAAGSAVFAAGVVVDVTEARRTESELARASRALEMLSRCNEALMRLTEERALLDEICRIGVEVGGYRMASVLYARDDADKTITPIAYAGHEAGYFSNIRISWSTAIAEGRGPVGCAVRAGRAVVVPDMAADPDFALWAPAALARGYRSVVALPLKSGERVFGAFCLYSGEVRSFPPKEVELLHELASDLAFGIAGLRVKDERQLLIETATTISDLSAASTGTAYFERVLKALLHCLGAQAGFVAGNPSADGGELETLCAVIDGEVVPHFHFSLLGTPCEDVVGDAELVIEREVCSAYPRAAALARLGAQAYVGRLLVDANGERIGTIFILYREPLRSRVLAVSMLRLFGTRVAAEIVRQRDESRLRDQALLLDKAQDAILVRSLDHKVGYWNQGAERLYGWSAREVENRSVIDFKVADAPRFLAAEEAVLREGEWMGELEELRKDGGRIWVECRWTLLRDDNGAPRSVLAINTDITERKMAQIMLAEKEARVAHAQKLESVGQLTGGIAHDFNNLLTVIIGNSEQLIDELAGRPPLAEMARMIRAAGGRGAELTSRLLAFARR